MRRRVRLTVIDLDIGNLQSVTSAFERVGAEVVVVRSPTEVETAGVLVLPGVGAFGRAMARIEERGFKPMLRFHALEAGRPLVGICLGMQLLADRSYEYGQTEGLGLIAGEVVKLEPEPPDSRVPNIGWMPVHGKRPSHIFPAAIDGQSFYHVHSYHLVCANAVDAAATITFGNRDVVTAVERGPIFGVQFHPEKSQDAGLHLLDSLVNHLATIA